MVKNKNTGSNMYAAKILGTPTNWIDNCKNYINQLLSSGIISNQNQCVILYGKNKKDIAYQLYEALIASEAPDFAQPILVDDDNARCIITKTEAKVKIAAVFGSEESFSPKETKELDDLPCWFNMFTNNKFIFEEV